MKKAPVEMTGANFKLILVTDLLCMSPLLPAVLVAPMPTYLPCGTALRNSCLRKPRTLSTEPARGGLDRPGARTLRPKPARGCLDRSVA